MQINKIIEFPDTFAFDVSDYCTEEEFNELNLQEYVFSLILNNKETCRNYQECLKSKDFKKTFIEFNVDQFLNNQILWCKEEETYKICKDWQNVTNVRKLVIYNRYIIDKLIFRVKSIEKINAEQNITINNQNSTINFHLIDIKCLKKKVNKLEEIKIKQDNINDNIIDEINYIKRRMDEFSNIITEQMRIINMFKDNIKYLEEKIDDINEVIINKPSNDDFWKNKIFLLEEKINKLEVTHIEKNKNIKSIIELILFLIFIYTFIF